MMLRGLRAYDVQTYVQAGLRKSAQPRSFTLEFTVRKHFKFALAIVLTVIITFMVTAYFATKNTRAAFVAATYDMGAFNELHRISSWDSLEQLLIKGCNKEALEYVRMEQSLGLLSLKGKLTNGAKLDKALEEENPSVLSRAHSIISKGKYYIPTCN